MSEDRELLERAARAAGITVVRSRLDDPLNRDMLVEQSKRNSYQRSGPWNPLTDDGDIARLEATLEIALCWLDDCVQASVRGAPYESSKHAYFGDHGGDRNSARRYASVRAAASLYPSEDKRNTE